MGLAKVKISPPSSFRYCFHVPSNRSSPFTPTAKLINPEWKLTWRRPPSVTLPHTHKQLNKNRPAFIISQSLNQKSESPNISESSQPCDRCTASHNFYLCSPPPGVFSSNPG